jgi:hypothetical protein
MKDFSRANDFYNLICAEGEAAIDEFIATRKAEELFLDFKRSSDNGAGVRLSQTDRDNLAKAISGFGNSAGGVVNTVRLKICKAVELFDATGEYAQQLRPHWPSRSGRGTASHRSVWSAGAPPTN